MIAEKEIEIACHKLRIASLERTSFEPLEGFADRIREALRSRLKHHSQAKLGQAMGVSDVRINNILAPRRAPNLTLGTIEEILIAGNELDRRARKPRP